MNIFEKRASKKKETDETSVKVIQKFDELSKVIQKENSEKKSSKTLKELKELAKARKIVGYSQMNKGELIGILEAYGVAT